jgi:hypothetical protein
MTSPCIDLPWRAALGAALLLTLGACSAWQPPQPWDKADLAREQMRMDGDPLDARFSQHIFASKEAASGGAGVGGGGCGCN